MIRYLIIYFLIWILTGALVAIRLSDMDSIEAENMSNMDRIIVGTVFGLMWPLFWILYIGVKITEVMK